MTRILFFASTTGYQTRAFEDAAHKVGVELVYVTDQCHRLDDPWRNHAITASFEDLARSTGDVVSAVDPRPIDGVLAVGDRPALLAAHVAERLGVVWHRASGAAAAENKIDARGRWLAAGLPTPWFTVLGPDEHLAQIADRVRFPCVVKPAALSASRGVVRANTVEELEQALARVARIVRAPDVRHRQAAKGGHLLIEGFIPGREYALEGLMDRGQLHVLAVFDKPDPLDGPYFEETIYVTPAALSPAIERAMAGTIAHAALAMELVHGPVHAECRINDQGVFLLEVAGRPIGGLCAQSLRFVSPSGAPVTLEELLLRHAAGEPLGGYARERQASGVMMIPVPGRGHFRGVDGLDAARQIGGIDDVIVSAKPGQLLEPWPEGHSYPGFIFARGANAEDVTAALRAAHARLRFRLDRAIPLS
jgi:biotin carboxylase